MAQVEFACRVLGFIKRLLNAVLPTLARDENILGTKEQFIEQIDVAFKALDPRKATKHDYRLAVANAACGEVSNLCGILTDACECAEFSDIASRYLKPQKFVRLVLKSDVAKIAALEAAVDDFGGNVGRLLMGVGAILEGRPNTYDTMDPAAKRKATLDTKKIIAEVKTIAQKLDDGKAEIIEHVDAVGGKVDRLRVRMKRKSKYPEAMREACLSYWEAAQSNAEIRYAINTRITYASVLQYFAPQLAKHGITTAAQFRKVLHAAQSRDCTERRKKLDEQRDGTKKKTPLPPPKKNGRMLGDGKGREKVRRQ